MDPYNISYNPMQQQMNQQEMNQQVIIIRTNNRVPRLISSDGFNEWKYRFENYLKSRDGRLWRSIKNGPTRITRTTEDVPPRVVDKKIDEYTDADFLLVEYDEKSLATLTMALPPDVAQSFRSYTSAKSLLEALIEMFEGNEDMQQSRKDLLRQRFNMFNHIVGETLEAQLQRFITLNT